MFRRKDLYLQKFQSLCDGGDVDCNLQINHLRQIILFRSNGLCPAHLLISPADGVLLPCRQLCNKATYGCVKRKNLLESQNLQAFIEKSRQREVKLMSSRGGGSKCAISVAQKKHLEGLAQTCKDDCKAFRRQLMQSNQLTIVAIHVCRWDGSPRKSISEIRDAICLYPSNPRRMRMFLTVFFSVVGVVVAGAAIYATLRQLSEAKIFSLSKLQCQNTTVHLIGETHHEAETGEFVEKFLHQLNQEPEDGNKSVVFVESKDHYNIHGLVIPHEDINLPKYLQVKETLAKALKAKTLRPVIFFMETQQVKNFYLPRHTIVYYDYRETGLVEFMDMTLSKLLQNDIDAESWQQVLGDLEKALNDQHVMIKESIDLSGTGIQEDLVALEKDFEKQISYFKEQFASTGPQQHQKYDPKWFFDVSPDVRALLAKYAQDHKNSIRSGIFVMWELLRYYSSMADFTFAAHVKAYLKQGTTPNIYAFMGKNHIPGTEALLMKQFNCKKK